MIRVFFKMVKFLSGLVVVFCLFILYMVTAMASVPYLTSKHYKNNESPSTVFKVVLESFEPSLNQPRFECVSWDDFNEMHPQAEDQNVYLSREEYNCRGSISVFEREYTTYLSVPAGSCANISSDFIVQNVDAHTQVVRLRWAQEASKVRNSYRVDANTVTPLFSCEFMSAGIAVSIFLVSIIALPIMVIFFRFCHKKYGALISTGWALIMLGLCTLNFAVFNYRLSMDPLSENSELFIIRNKIVLIASGILFVCAGVSFWIHKNKRLSTRD
jgi:hypothetical protein